MPLPNATTHFDILQAVRQAVSDLNLPLVPRDQIYLRRIPTDRQVTLPACIIAPIGVETLPPSTNASDDVGFPVLITLVNGVNKDTTALASERAAKDLTMEISRVELEWRQEVRRAFHNKRLPGLEQRVYRCIVEPQPILDLPIYRDADLVVSSLLVRCFVREQR